MKTNSRLKFQNAPYTDLNLYVDHPVTDALFDTILAKLSSNFSKRARSQTKDQAAIAVISVISNLLRATWSGAPTTSISLARGTYTQTKLQGIGYKAINKALEFLTSPQIHNETKISPMLTLHRGFMGSNGFKENSKLELNPDSIVQWILISLDNSQYKELDAHEFVKKGDIVYKSMNNKVVNNQTTRCITPITSTLKPRFLTRCDKSPIRLVDENGRRIELFPSPEIDTMVSELSAYNDFLSCHTVGLFLSDEEVENLLFSTRNRLAERGTNATSFIPVAK